MIYIDKIAWAVGDECDMSMAVISEAQLLRIYALLCLTLGERTNQKDVHDAWSVWKIRREPEHKSLVPFEELTKEVQDYDQPYVDAIHAVAKTL